MNEAVFSQQPSVVSTQQSILQTFKCSHQQVLALCEDVPSHVLEEQALTNGWSIKDTVAHLAAWLWRCVNLINAAHYTNGPFMAKPDVEGLNYEFYRRQKNWDWSQVEFDFHQAHQALLEAIKQLPAERLADPVVRRAIAHDTWEHFEHHLQDIKSYLVGREEQL